LLGADTLRGRGLFKPEEVARMVREHQSGTADHTYRIWALLTLEVWQRAVLDA
jgi:asparagine synthase (glutamine-hydrolysing)